MEWTADPTTERYTLAADTCSATVWNSGRHGYAAKISYGSMTTAQYGFTTLENAQAWCLTGLAAMRAAGRCGSAAVTPDGNRHTTDT
jgi:hypothetical protein